MSDDDLKNELERLRKENAAPSVCGMGRFPITLYKEQWLKVLDMADDIRTSIAANEGTLKAKS